MQEGLKAAEYRTLFKRLYADAERQRKFDLTNEQRYLAHAILQLTLYSIEQACKILYNTQKGCINDGTNAFTMSQESFVSYMENCNHQNPETRASIKPETFYFYNCHIEADKFNNDNTNNRFGDGFEAYKAAYNKVKLIILGLTTIDQSLPQEIKDVSSKIEMKKENLLPIIISLIKNAQSAEEIKELLEKIADKNKDDSLGKTIKGILENIEFKAKYLDTKEGFLTQFKNFVIKCFLAIYEFAKWLFTVDLTHEAKDNWKENCKAATGNSSQGDFKAFVITKLN